MSATTSLLDGAKATTYEVLAVLLPGAVALFGLERAGVTFWVGGTIQNLGAAYVVGTIVQAIASAVTRIPCVRHHLATDSPIVRSAQDVAVRLIQRRLEQELPVGVDFDVCLSRVESTRHVYDKFIALRDTARGLVVASVLGGSVVIGSRWKDLVGGAPLAVVGRLVALLAGTLILLGVLTSRYSRFASLARQAVYGQCIASFLDDRRNRRARRRSAVPQTSEPRGQAQGTAPSRGRNSDLAESG